MHCVTLAELAATVSKHGSAIIARRVTVPAAAVTCYWASSRNRFEQWNQVISRYHSAIRTGNTDAIERWWDSHLSVMEEILVSELLTRVVAAVTAETDHAAERDEFSPVTQAIYLSHIGISNRVAELILQGRGLSVKDTVKLNRLRTGVERWTDALLGRMSLRTTEYLNFCVDRQRTQEFAMESRNFGDAASSETAGWLIQASMREMLCRRTSPEPALPQANRNVADAVLLMYQPELFDDFGSIKSALLNRIERGATITECSPTAILQGQQQMQSQDQGQQDAGGQLGPSNPSDKFERWYL
ncbi:MAG: hypothetical protein HKN47_14400 [Pirellulaceae bacterium]|nr:hypothetical protein [Pirellulaceae bacterium]